MSQKQNSETFQYIGDIAKRLGVSTRAIRYYEELGLIVPKRSNGGFREYSETEIEKLGTLLKLKKLGLSFEEIRKLVGIRNCVGNKDSVNELLKSLHGCLHEFEEKIKDYRSGIKEIQKMISFIDHCSDCKDHAKNFKCEQCLNGDKKMPDLMKALF